jgi:hypothetical protein
MIKPLSVVVLVVAHQIPAVQVVVAVMDIM